MVTTIVISILYVHTPFITVILRYIEIYQRYVYIYIDTY